MNTFDLGLDVVRGSLVLGAALAAMPLLARAPAAARRAVLVAALALSIAAPLGARALRDTAAARYVAIPLVARGASVEPIVGAETHEETVGAAAVDAARAPSSSRAAWDLLRGVDLAWAALAAWALGALVVAARLLHGVVAARALARRAEPISDPRVARALAEAAARAGATADVRVTDELAAPATVGLFSATVLLPRDAAAWSDARLRVVLLHELAHVRRRDCATFTLARLACAARWFDPLAWIAAARLRREREFAADEAVVDAGVLPSAYAAELLAVASRGAAQSPALALGMAAARSEIARRIEALVTASSAPRRPTTRAALALVALGVTTAGAACAGTAQPPADASIGRPAAILPPEALRGAAASSIDASLQAAFDEEAARVTAAWSPRALTMIAIDPRTSAVLAMVGADVARAPIVPGSTFKVVTLAAALDAGALSPDATLDCGGGARAYGDRTLRDWAPFGSLSLADSIAVSSNVCASRMFDALGPQRLATYADRFHVAGEPPGGAAPSGVEAGFVGALAAIGESRAVPPLAMAGAFGAIANDGLYGAPTFTRGQPKAERVVSADTARRVRTILEGAVTSERATGSRARVDGLRVAGKTGTAEWEDATGPHTYASFIGMAPADAPRVVVLVGAIDPKDKASGGQVAAPAFAHVAARAVAAATKP